MPTSQLSIRIDLPSGHRFGPGKAALLRSLLKTGSIRAAADALNMSYPRALKLIEQMNTSFRAPLVETQHGGSTGGGASVTQTGQDMLAFYDQICRSAQDENAAALENIKALLIE